MCVFGCSEKAFMCNAVRVHLFSTLFFHQEKNGEQDFCLLAQRVCDFFEVIIII